MVLSEKCNVSSEVNVKISLTCIDSVTEVSTVETVKVEKCDGCLTEIPANYNPKDKSAKRFCAHKPEGSVTYDIIEPAEGEVMKELVCDDAKMTCTCEAKSGFSGYIVLESAVSNGFIDRLYKGFILYILLLIDIFLKIGVIFGRKLEKS
jgi:hypothetical protein